VLRVTDQDEAGTGETKPDGLTAHPILLYDGVCGLCNRSVQFILRHDRKARFRFAALQSTFAAPILRRHGANPAELETVYVVVNHEPTKQDQPEEALLARSDAVLFVLRQLGGVWQALAVLLRLLPRPLRDRGYGVVAHYRYRIFGRYDSCPMPSAETRARFLDQ
jgi:predicted DCC family thiol-disulfide oxidoreductase YuxK